MWYASAGRAVADDLGVDRRAAPLRVLELLEDEHAGALADDEAVAILVERAAGAAPARRCASTARAAAPKPPTLIGVIAASEPPAIIASASPRLMISNDSPMACAEAEQAVHVARFGPLAPNRIDTWPAARLMMADGMKNGEILRGPPFEQRLVLALDGGEPADAGPDEDADVGRVLRR